MNLYIIIVTYNAEKYLERCLGPFVNKPENWNIIVIDNKSSDNTCEIINQKYNFVNLIKSDKNLGFGNANNIGLKIAYKNNADCTLLLNQDAYIDIETIQDLIKISKKNPDYYIISPIQMNDNNNLDFGFYANMKQKSDLLEDYKNNKIKKEIYEINNCPAACWLINRTCLQSVGGFNPSFYHYGEDDNYVDRVHYCKGKVGVVPSCFVVHDRQEKTTDKLYFNQFSEKYRYEILIKLSNPQKSSLKKYTETEIKLVLRIIRNFLCFNFDNFKLNLKLFLTYKKDKKSLYSNFIQSKNKGANFIE